MYQSHFGITADYIDAPNPDPLLGLLAKGTTGAWWSPVSGLIYQGAPALTGTPTTTNGQNIGTALDHGRWGGRTFAQEIALQSSILGLDFTTAGWTTSGSANIVDNDTFSFAANGDYVTISPLTIGRTYRLQASWVRNGGGKSITIAQGTTSNVQTLVTQGAPSVVYDGIFVAQSVGLRMAVGTGTTSNMDFSVFNLREVPGRSARQSTDSLKPKLQAGPVFRPDGSDDNLLTPIVPGSAGFMGGRVVVPASVSALQTIIGGSIGTSRCYVGLDTSRRLCAGIGTQPNTTIVGANDLGGQTLCLWLTWDGSRVRLHENGVPVYSAAQAGSVGVDPLRLFATNQAGAAANYGGMDAHHLVCGIGYAPTTLELLTLSNHLNA